jgi:hypothetical protein
MTLTVEIETDPEEIDSAQKQHALARINLQALNKHAQQISAPENWGKYVCLAGGEYFIGETGELAEAKAKRAHPSDNGSFVQYIPLDNNPRLYADLRMLG